MSNINISQKELIKTLKLAKTRIDKIESIRLNLDEGLLNEVLLSLSEAYQTQLAPLKYNFVTDYDMKYTNTDIIVKLYELLKPTGEEEGMVDSIIEALEEDYKWIMGY